jgi:two-component system OmpR family sensor kinase
VSRLPIRVRLSLAFAAAMALLLTALGAFLFLQVRSSLDEQVNAGLRAQAGAVSAGNLRGGALVEEDESIRQLIGAEGSVLAASPQRLRSALVPPGGRTRFIDRDIAELRSSPYRLLVTQAESGRTVVVGASLEERNEALQGLLAALLVGGPIALVLATIAGYLLAGALLRPVELMRRRAAEISTETTGRKLPLPRAHDEIFRLGQTLNDMLARLEAGLIRERRFVADASHELRTPLALLRTELELARRRPRTADELRAALDSAAAEVDRLTRLAEDLLVLARADEGRLALRREPIAVHELLETVARRFGTQIDVATPDGETIVGDRLRLEQALGNLVDNARRYGGGTIRLEAERSDGRMELRVTDEGNGFPAALLPHAFDRFTRGDEARAGGGAGLGLALVDAVARAHGGTARAANRDRRGAVVTLELPA